MEKMGGGMNEESVSDWVRGWLGKLEGRKSVGEWVRADPQT